MQVFPAADHVGIELAHEWDEDGASDEANLALERIDSLETELANTAERLHTLRQSHEALVARTASLEDFRAADLQRITYLETQLLSLIPNPDSTPLAAPSVPPPGSTPNNSIPAGPSPSRPSALFTFSAPPSATSETTSSLRAMVLSVPQSEPPILSHGPLLHNDKVGWRFSLQHSGGPFGVNIIVNPLEHSVLPAFQDMGNSVEIPDWCTVQWFRCIPDSASDTMPSEPFRTIALPKWFTGDAPHLDMQALMSPIQYNASVTIEPLEFTMLHEALQTLAVWAHTLSAKINAAIQMVGRAMPLVSYSLDSAGVYTFEVSLLPLFPQAQVHVLTWDAPLDIEEEAWAQLLMESRASISWTLCDKILKALSSGARRQCGILLSLLALCSPAQSKYPNYKLVGTKKGTDTVGTVIQLMEKTFGANSHVQPTSLQLYYNHIRNTPLTPLPPSSVWSDECLLRSLPTSTLTINDIPVAFPFPLWEASATHPSKARLKWAPSLDSVGSPYTVGLLCQTLCTPTEILLLSPLPTPRAPRTAIPSRMPSHAEYINLFRVELTRSLIESRKAALKDLANTRYGPALFPPSPPCPNPQAHP